MNAPVKSMPSFGEVTRLFIEAGISEKALIPIAPPGAEISAKGSLSPRSLGKAPGRYLPRDKVWCGLGENSDGARYIAEGATAQDIHERASWPTRNAGLLGRYFPAIDSDASSDDARKLVEDALVRVFRDDAPYVAERIRGAGPRRLYALRCADPDDPKTWVKSGSFRYRLPRDPEGEFPHGLDVIGYGKQFVATGVHPSGDLYRWRKGYDLCELHQDDELACAADADMADFRAALVEAVEAAGGEVQQGTHGGGGGDRRDYTTDEPAMPVEALFRGLERVPNTKVNFPTHDSFVAVLAKILAALGCEAEAERDRVEEWACEDLELCPLEYFERTWESFRGGVSEKRHALEMHFRDKRIFPNLENEFPALTENEKDGLAAVTKPFREKQDALLSEFAERYVLSRANAAADEKVPTIRRRDDPDNAVVALNWWQSRTDDLNVQVVQKLRTCGQYTPDEGGLWNFIRDIRKTRPEIMFTGTTLDPNFERGEIVIERNPDDSVTRKLNMRYQSPVIRCAKNSPQNLEQAQADLKTVLEFIRRLIGPDAEYELDTLAHMVQTGKRPGNLLFIVGDPGVGKSTYVLLLRAMFDGIGRNHVSAVWAAPSGRRCEGDIRSGMGAPSHVDVRTYGYVGADPAPGAVYRGRPAADVVG